MKVLAVLPDANAPNLINVVLPLRFLAQRGALAFEVAYEYTVTPAQVVSADVIAAARNVEPIYRPVFELARARGIPIIYVLDDWLLGVPEDDESIHYYGTEKRRAHCAWMLRHADLVRAHSPHLRELLRPYTERVVLAQAAVDWSLVPPELPTLGERVEIVYATGRQNDRLIAPVLPDIRRILEDYAGRVRVHFITYHPPELRGVSGVVFVPNEPDYAAFMAKFTRAGYSIGLAPMRRDDFHLAKTNAKFRDYAAAGAAGIYTDCALYAGEGGVIHDRTGLLVGDEAGAWYAAMRALIEDRPRLERIRRAARAYAQQHYAMETCAAAWLDDLRAVARPIRDRRPPEIARWWFTRSARRVPPGLVRWYRRAVPAKVRVGLRDLRMAVRAMGRRGG
jgi:glycosyltransferase involved in cell wall biosynthesis